MIRTTKLLEEHKEPPGLKCVLGDNKGEEEEDQNQGLDLETAAAHQYRRLYGAVQGPLAGIPLLSAKMCGEKAQEWIREGFFTWGGC